MPVVRDLITRFGADPSGFKKGTSEVKAALVSLNKDFSENKSTMKDTATELKNLEAEMKKYNSTGGGETKEQQEQFKKLSARIEATKLKMAQLKTEEQDIKGKVSNATSELKKQNNQFTEMSSKAGKAQTSLGSLGGALKLLVTGYTGKKLYDVLIGSNADMEQYLTSFTVMLGSAEKAKNLINDITKMAAKTPFELTDLTKAGQMLMNYGVGADAVIGKMTQLGNLSMGNAEKLDRISLAYGQMLSKGKVSGEELRQMTEAGVPLLNALAESIGVSTAELSKMIEAGKVGIPELDAAIASLTTGDGKFTGMMEEQSKTFSGMLSTIKDSIAQFGREVGEETFETVKSSITDLMSALDTANENGTLAALANEIGNAINSLVKSLIKAVEFVWKYRDAIAVAGTAMIAFKASMSILQIVQGVAAGFTALKVALVGLQGAQKAAQVAQVALNTTMAINPVLLIISAVAALTVGLIALANSMDDASNKAKLYADEMERAKEAGQQIIDSGENEISVLELKAKTYEELRSKVNRTAAETEALKTVAGELLAILPEGTQQIDNQTGAYKSLNTEIENVIKNMRTQSAMNSIKTEYDEVNTQLRDLNKDKQDAIIRMQEDNQYAEEHPTLFAIKTGGRQTQASKDYDIALQQIAEREAQKKALEQETKDLLIEGSTIPNAEPITMKNQYLSPPPPSEVSAEFKAFYEKLRQEKTAYIITDEEYNQQLLENLQANGYEKMGAYNQYWGEVLGAQKKAEKGALSEQEKAGKDTLSAQKKSDAEELAADKERFAQLLKQNKDNYKKLYDERKESVEKAYKDQLKAIDSEYKAQEAAIDAKIKLMETEDKAQKEFLQNKISAIDKEIEERKRLTEDTDSQKEIDALTAKLTYSQLDEFSRMELEKQLQQLQAQKAESDWQRAKADEKAGLQEQMGGIGSDTDKLKEQLSQAKELADYKKQAIEEEQAKVIEMMEMQKTKIEEGFTILSENSQKIVTENMNNINQETKKMGDNFAGTVKTQIGGAFDFCISKANNAIAELRNATGYASQLAASFREAANTSSGGNTYNQRSVSSQISINNPALSSRQIEDIINDAIY